MDTQEGWNAGRVSPREMELRKFRESRVKVKFCLMTDEVIEGAVAWYDEHAVHVVKSETSEVTILFNVVSTYEAVK
jgi:sRNA-binding regulator protein Hfq